jgi:hypothetical protein
MSDDQNIEKGKGVNMSRPEMKQEENYYNKALAVLDNIPYKIDQNLARDPSESWTGSLVNQIVALSGYLQSAEVRGQMPPPRNPENSHPYEGVSQELIKLGRIVNNNPRNPSIEEKIAILDQIYELFLEPSDDEVAA